MSLDIVSELGSVIGGISKAQDDTKDAINPNEETAQRQYYMTDNVIVEQLPLVVKRRDILTSSLWDVAKWDEDLWNETYGTGFILGHVSQGVLGSNSLGPSGADQVVALVYNDNNTYKEYFKTDLFEDTSVTTATWGPDGLVFSSSTVTIGQSLAVAYSADDPQTYTKATMNVKGTDTSGLKYYLSADAGVTWEENIPGTEHIFTQTGTDLRFRTANSYAMDAEMYLDLETQPAAGGVSDYGSGANEGTFKINASAYYPFNGNANDESVNSNDGTVTGATLTTDYLGTLDNAYNFDGTVSQYLSIPYGVLNGLSDFTVAFWAQGSGKTGSYILSGANAVNDNEMLMHSPTDTDWHFYVWRRNSLGTHIYEDLIESDSFIYANPSDPIDIDAGGLIFGQEQDSVGGGFAGPQAFRGKLSSFLVIPLGITDDEMLNLYNTTSTHKLDKPLVTKTDSDGNSIKGYEFWGQMTGTEDMGTYLDITDTVSSFESGDLTIYLEFLANDLNNSSAMLNHYNWNFWLSANGNSSFSVGRMNDGSGPQYSAGQISGLITTNKKYKVIGLYHPDASGGNGYIRYIIYSEGAQVFDSGEVSIGSDIIWTGYGSQNVRISNSEHGVATMFNGICSKPLIYDRVLSESERDIIFTKDIAVPVITSTDTITKLTIKYII